MGTVVIAIADPGVDRHGAWPCATCDLDAVGPGAGEDQAQAEEICEVICIRTRASLRSPVGTDTTMHVVHGVPPPPPAAPDWSRFTQFLFTSWHDNLAVGVR